MCIRDRDVGFHRQFHPIHGRPHADIGRREVTRFADPDIGCLLYTSDAADERSSVDLGGRRIIKKKKNK